MVKSFLFVLLFAILSYGAETLPSYTVHLNDWSEDIAAQLKNEAPEMNNHSLTEEQLNKVLKKLDQKFKFNNLRWVKVGTSNELLLAGEISAQIEKIKFQGLEDISDSEALLLMSLSLKNAVEEDYVKSAIEKLVQYYQEQGYRFATVEYQYQNLSNLKKNLLLKVFLKSQTKISEIILDHLDPGPQEDIQSKLNWQFKNKVLNQETLNNLTLSLRKYLSRSGYYLTQVPSAQLIFSADELRAKAYFKLDKKNRYSVEILNANEFSKHYLADDILKLDTYFSTDSSFGADLAEKLKAFYKSEGYPHINISYYERKESGKIIVTLNLEEGVYSEIKGIYFVGQFSRTNSYYERKLLELASSKVQSRIYVKEDIEQASKNLLFFLQNEGYVNARLGLVQITTDREKPEEGLVTIQLYEGLQVELESIEFIGNTQISSETLKQQIELEPGKKLNLKYLDISIAKLKAYYTGLGYIEFKLLNEATDLIQYNNKNTGAQLKFKIDEGPRVEVQSILIEGNDRTHEKVILTEVDFKVGDILTPAKLEESIARLQRTGYFSVIDISTLEAGTNISLRTVIIKVTERDPGIFTIGGGVTNENNGTIHGYTGLAYRNIGGWGRGVSVRTDGNYNYAGVRFIESKITFGFVEPYLFESRTRFRTNLTRSRSIADYNLRKVTELNSTTFSLEQDFTSHFTGIWDVLNVSTYVDKGITSEDELTHGYSREDLVIASTGITLDSDYRNNLFNPTRGHFSRISIEYAADQLGNSNVDDFIRLNGQTTWYYTIPNSDSTWAQSFRGGYVQDIRPLGYGIPYDKKGFTLGGRSTIRGFGSSEFFPSTELTKSPYRLTSFASYELIKSELRFPLIKKWDLMGAFFYDGGQVFVNGFNFEDRWRDSVGFGIRYNTPVGPLNLEFAKKLDKKAGEDDGAFHLSIGVF